MLDKLKKGWEDIWLPRIQEGKTKVQLERDRRYEARWVWYHTVLAIELFIIILIQIGILWKNIESFSYLEYLKLNINALRAFK